MSQNDQTTAVLAAAFGSDAVAQFGDTTQTITPAPAAPVQDDTLPNLFVGLEAPAPAPATLTPATPAAPATPVADAQAELQARLNLAEQQAAYFRGLAEASAAAPTPTAPAAPEPAAYDPNADTLSPEEALTYKDSLPVIEKMARRIAHNLVAQSEQKFSTLQQTTAELQARLQEVQGVAVRNDEHVLMQNVRAAVADIDTISKSREWKSYLQTRAPFGGGRSVQDVIQHAVKTRDHETIVEYANAFRASHNIATPPAPSLAPGRSAAPASVGLEMPAQRRGISASALDEAMAKVQAGTLSKEAYDKMLAQVYGAAASGLELVQ